MRLIDTDHLSVLLDPRHKRHDQLVERLRSTNDLVALPLVVVEEQLRAWLAQIHRVTDVHQQIVPYLRLHRVLDFLRDWKVIVWNEPAADVFKRLRKERVRIGTLDLKIASLAISTEAVLLSANLRDFEQVPGLRCEDWLYGS